MASGLATSLVGTAITAISYPLALHYLGYDRYGLWLLLSTIVTFSQLGNLGVAQAVSREVAQAHSVSDTKQIRNSVTNGIFLLLASGFFVLTLILSSQGRIVAALHLSAENSRVAVAVIPYIGLLSIYVFIVDATNAILAGMGRIDICNYIQLGSQLLAAILGMTLLWRGVGVFGLLCASTVSYMALHAASLFAIRRIHHESIFSLSALSVGGARRLLSFGLNLTAGGILAMVLSPINKIILARFAGLHAIPIYDLSFTGGMRIRNLFDSSQRAIIPEISRLLTRSRVAALDRARDLNRRSLKVMLLAAPAYAILIALAPLLLQFWLKSRFDPASPFTVRVMLAGTFASLIGMPTYYTLIALGRARDVFMANLVQLLANLILVGCGIALIPLHPATLVVVSTAIGMACSSIYLGLRCWRATDAKSIGLTEEFPDLTVA